MEPTGQLITVKVPQGSVGGNMLHFETPEGEMQVKIPAGFREGTSFQVQLPTLPTEDVSRSTRPGREDAMSVGAQDGEDLAHAPHSLWPIASPAALRADGVALYHDALRAHKVAALRAHCEATLDAARAAVAAGERTERDVFNAILLRGSTRHDLKLGLDPVVLNALAEITATVGPSVREVFGCNPCLAEIGAIRSTDGAPRQPIHTDTGPSQTPQLLTTFVALQDIDEAMGPTTFLPGTHCKPEAGAALAEPDQRSALLRRGPVLLGTMAAGACTLYDSRLLHAGGPNQTPHARWLLYFSFSPSIELASELRGNGYGELQAHGYTLSDLEEYARLVAEQEGLEKQIAKVELVLKKNRARELR